MEPASHHSIGGSMCISDSGPADSSSHPLLSEGGQEDDSIGQAGGLQSLPLPWPSNPSPPLPPQQQPTASSAAGMPAASPAAHACPGLPHSPSPTPGGSSGAAGALGHPPTSSLLARRSQEGQSRPTSGPSAPVGGGPSSAMPPPPPPPNNHQGPGPSRRISETMYRNLAAGLTVSGLAPGPSTGLPGASAGAVLGPLTVRSPWLPRNPHHPIAGAAGAGGNGTGAGAAAAAGPTQVRGVCGLFASFDGVDG